MARTYTAQELADMIKRIANYGGSTADKFNTEADYYNAANYGEEGAPAADNKDAMNLFWGDQIAKESGMAIADQDQRRNLGKNVLANRNLARLNAGVNNGAYTGLADSWAGDAANWWNTGQLGGTKSAAEVMKDLKAADDAARAQGLTEGPGKAVNDWLQNWDTKNAVGQLLARDYAGGTYDANAGTFDTALDAHLQDPTTDWIQALQNSPWVQGAGAYQGQYTPWTPQPAAGPGNNPGGGNDDDDDDTTGGVPKPPTYPAGKEPRNGFNYDDIGWDDNDANEYASGGGGSYHWWKTYHPNGTRDEWLALKAQEEAAAKANYPSTPKKIEGPGGPIPGGEEQQLPGGGTAIGTIIPGTGPNPAVPGPRPGPGTPTTPLGEGGNDGPLDDNTIKATIKQYNGEDAQQWQINYWKARSAQLGGQASLAQLQDNATTKTIAYYNSIAGTDNPGWGPKPPTITNRNDRTGAGDFYDWLWAYPPNRATMRDKETWVENFLNNVVGANGG